MEWTEILNYIFGGTSLVGLATTLIFWNKSKLAEKMHEFMTATLGDAEAVYAFAGNEPVGAESNAKMYVVNYMMAYWLGNVRPDYTKQYLERANFEMDDLLRKCYKKEAPV